MPQSADQNTKPLLDGKPSLLAAQIQTWETEAKTARDEQVDRFFGPRLKGVKGGNDSGMRGLVNWAHKLYVGRGWELPPYNYRDLENDYDRLSYPWFFGNMQRLLPMMAPTDVKLRAIPLRGDKKVVAAQANALLDEESEYLQLDQHNQGLVLGAKLYGSQVAYYGVRKNRGQFDLRRVAELVDPLSFLWEPGATSVADAKYLIWKRWIPIAEARREYNPNFDIEPEDMLPEFSSTVLLSGSHIAKSQSRCIETIVFIRDSGEREEIIQSTEIQEQVLTDYNGNVLPDETGNPVIIPVEVQVEVPTNVLNYPFGRIVSLINNKIVGDQEPGEKYPYDHHRCPFVKLDNYSFPGTFWGIPDSVANGDMPHIVNESISMIVKGARRSFKKFAVESSKMETKLDDLNNDTDDLIQLKEGAIGGRWHETVDLSGMGPEYLQALQATLQMSDKSTGVSDAVRGVANPEVQSGKHAEILTQNATQRASLFLKQLSEHHKEAGVQILRNAVQFRQPDEVVEIVSNFSKSTPFSIAEFPKDAEFRIKIAPYSGLPSDRQERLDQLFDIIPKLISVFPQSPELADAIVKLSDSPELEEAWELAKVNLVARQQAMEQAAMSQVTPPPQPGVPDGVA